MLRVFLAVFASLVLFVPVVLAGFPTNRFVIYVERDPFRQQRTLAAVKGEAWFATAGFGMVHDAKLQFDEWYLDGTRIKNCADGSYLAYDPNGKNPKLFTVPEPPAGVEWRIQLKKSPSAYQRGTIEAATGAVAGWKLDTDEPPENNPNSRLEQPPSIRVFLTEKPQHVFVVKRIVIGK